jgi:hypothetical protein
MAFFVTHYLKLRLEDTYLIRLASLWTRLLGLLLLRCNEGRCQ